MFVEVPRSQSYTDTRGRTLPNEYHLVAVAASYTKITSQKTIDHNVIGARTLQPRKETAANLQIRSHGQ
jgi:hypothetical protein